MAPAPVPITILPAVDNAILLANPQPHQLRGIFGNIAPPLYPFPLPAFITTPFIYKPKPRETEQKSREERMNLGKRHIRRKRRLTLKKRGSRK